MSLLTVAGLAVRYGGVPALRNIDLTVAEGEVLGVVGANGAGKTTLLAAVMRLVPWASGSISFAGRSLAKDSPDGVARAGVALVPEGRQIFGSMTVAENLRLGLVARADRSPRPRPLRSTRRSPCSPSSANTRPAPPECCPAASNSSWPSPGR